MKAFYLSRTEVTVGAYRRCVEAAACTAPAFGAMSRFDRPELPVTFVNWQQASDYCRFRGCACRGKPSSSAPRGGTRRRFRGVSSGTGDSPATGDSRATPTDPSDGFVELAPVGSFPSGRTKEGVLDLAGNASEWMKTLTASSSADLRWSGSGCCVAATTRPQLPGYEPQRGVRKIPTFQASTVGFRCAKPAIGSGSARP